MKSFSIKVVLAFIFPFLIIYNGQSQTDVDSRSIKPLRLGVKVGVPNILTANAEYVTPLFGNRVAIAVDYMSLSQNISDTDINYSNFEIGSNVYFNSTGKGFYGSISYFSFDGDGTYTDIEYDNGYYGDGTGSIKFNTINLKLGVKLGRTFFFRFEVGYGFGDIPEHVLVTSTTTSQTAYEEIPEIPGISSSGVPVFNLGIGFGLF